MKQKTAFALLLFIVAWELCTRAVLAQEPSGGETILEKNLNNTIPPSPTAASLGKFGDMPVGLYTGTPQISIPLGEVKGKELSLPISLSYHASGIKVEEIPSWVGLGWALNAGGVITRTVREKPDEMASHGYFNYCHYGLPANPNWQTLWDMVMGPVQYDTEPDIYSFNFDGKSGQFVIDASNATYISASNVHIMPYQQLRIDPIMSGPSSNREIESFVFTDEQGTKYYFGDVELTDVSSITSNTDGTNADQSSTQSYNSSWYLSKIVSANNTDTIKLYYNEKWVGYEYKASQSITSACGNLGGDGGSSINISTTRVFTKELDKIESFFGEVIFYSSDERKDLKEDTGSRLDSLLFLSASSYTAYIFSYSYMQSPASNVSYEQPYHKYRLKLNKLTQAGGIGELFGNIEDATRKEMPPYIFTYNSLTLPSRASNARDHWGYYNGKPNGNYMVPDLYFMDRYYPGANRDVDPSYLRAGILEKITYPTSGYTAFEYEANDYSFIGGIDIATTGDSVYYCTKTLHTTYPAGSSVAKECSPFEIDFPQLVYFDVDINDEDNSQALVLEFGGNGWPLAQYDKSSSQEAVMLDSGLYQIKFLPCLGLDCPTLHDGEVTVSYSRICQTPSQHKQFAGGLRVKKVTDYDGISPEKKKIKEYGYMDITDAQRSSGVLTSSLPQYFYIQAGGTSGECENVIRTSSSQNEIGTTQGSHIGYQYVTVYEGGKDDSCIKGLNGKTVYEYTTARDYGTTSSPQHYPFPPVVAKDWKRGLLVSKTTYNRNNKIVQEETNTYKDVNPSFSSLPGMKVKVTYLFTTPEQTVAFNDSLNNRIDFSYYTMGFDTRLAKSNTQKIYDDNGENPVYKTTEYTYNNYYLHMDETSETTSDGGKMISTYSYPHQFFEQAYTEMHNRHMNDIVVGQTMNYCDKYGVQETISSQKTNYKLENGLVLPSFIEEFEPGKGMVTKLTFNQHDSHGNLLQMTGEDKVPVSLVWGYNYSLPVAKIVNARYQDVESVLSPAELETIGKAYEGYGGSPVIGILTNKLRDNLPGTFVTSYRYLPGIGLTNVTDPNKMTTTYEYDEFTRLKAVKDNKSKIMKSYGYYYSLVELQPQDQEACEGSPATFSITAEEVGAYQWQEDLPGLGYKDIPGATGPTYTFTATADKDGHSFRCVLDGAIVSDPAQLIVRYPPYITAQPSQADVCQGNAATLSITVTGSKLSYQWQKTVNQSQPFANVSGGTSASYSTGSAGVYRCIASNVCSSVTSNAVGVIVIAPPAITVQPQDAYKCNGVVSFELTAQGDNLAYQWYRERTNITDPELVGGNNNKYSFTPGAGDNYNDEYWCKVASGGICPGANITSSRAEYIAAPLPTTPVINGPVTFQPGQQASYSVSNPNSNYTYKWSLSNNYDASSVSLPVYGTGITFRFGIDVDEPCIVSVTAIDACGNTSTKSKTVYVE